MERLSLGLIQTVLLFILSMITLQNCWALAWFEAKQQSGEPLFVFEENGVVAGYQINTQL